jgi:hypothetical protein
MLVALAEQKQTEDGDILLPKALQPFFAGCKSIKQYRARNLPNDVNAIDKTAKCQI